MSSLHFGHYKAGARSSHILHLHAMNAAVAIKAGLGLDCWARGLSVMLETIPGCHLVTKLRSILLMEADFNCTKNIIYGNWMLESARQHGYMPDEFYSEKNCTAEEGLLTKILFYDVVWQSCFSAGVSSVDLDNCNDQVPTRLPP